MSCLYHIWDEKKEKLFRDPPSPHPWSPPHYQKEFTETVLISIRNTIRQYQKRAHVMLEQRPRKQTK
jgi:hypothetical protein